MSAQLSHADDEFALRHRLSTRAGSSNDGEIPWRIVHWASLVAVFVLVVVIARHRWFVTDEWDLWAARAVTGKARYGMLGPHEGHLIVVPILVGRSMFAVFGLRHVVPYLVVLGLAHVALGAALWGLCRDAGVSPALSACGIAAFLLNGAAGENLVFPYQATIVFSLALVVVAVRHFGRGPRWTRGDVVALCAVVVASAMYGVGPIGAGTLVLLGLLRRRWRVGLVAGGVPLLLYALWALAFEGTTPNPRRPPSLAHVIPRLPRHVVETFARSAGAVVDSTSLGAVLVVLGLAGLCVVAWRSGLRPPVDAVVVLVVAAGAVAVAVAISSGPITTTRDFFGHRVRVVPSHSVHETLALCLPALLVVVDRVLRRVKGATVPIVVVAATAAIVGNWSSWTSQARTWQNAGARLEREVAALQAHPSSSNAPVDRILAPYLRRSDVARLTRSGALPRLPAPPSP